MTRWSHTRIAASLGGMLLMAGTAPAQQNTPAQQNAPGANPGTAAGTPFEMSDRYLQVRATLPQEIRVGEQFEYQVRVTNTSDNLTLHDIRLQQTDAQGFQIESISQDGAQGGNSQRGNSQSGTNAGGNQRGNNQQGQNRGNSQANRNQRNRNQNQAGQNQGNQNRGNQQGNQAISIDRLDPGQSKTVRIQAAADREGQLQTCLEVVSYRPAICLSAEVVKPELAIEKVGPKQANRCEMIEYTYTIRNDGTGDIARFNVVDPLAEGLMTIDGAKELSFAVDGLAAGQERAFVGRVFASRPGQFASRAEARAESSDLKARSTEVSTRVESADLQVDVTGPNTLLSNQPAVFRGQVTNTGNVAAEQVVISAAWPDAATLVQISEPSMVDDQSGNNRNANNQANNNRNANNQANNNRSSGDKQANNNRSSGDKQANNNRSSDDKQQNAGNQSQGMKIQDKAGREMMIARLEPGQTAEFQYIVRPNQLEEIPTKVVASYICEVEAAEGRAEGKASDRVEATAMATVRIVRLPALQIYVVDSVDPIPSGGETVYTIRVLNEGDAPDRQLKITAELPQGLSLVNANGPTDSNNEGQMVNFDPLEQLGPGDSIEYRVTAKSSGQSQGDVKLRVKLDSESQSQTINSEEPTTLVKGQ